MKPLFAMFAQFCNTVTTLFGAAEKSARALDNIASWAEEGTGVFKDEATIERKIKTNELAKRLKASE